MMSDTTVGICGNQAPTLMPARLSLWCDLPAGHAGWHGATPPGFEVLGQRTSWSNEDDETGHLRDHIAALEAERDRMRPVVEAARAWRSVRLGEMKDAVALDRTHRELRTEVDAFESGPHNTGSEAVDG